MKIVLANSIGVDRQGNYIIHSPSRWSSGVKNKYHWFAYYPWELAYLSALLKKNTDNEVKLIDGCLEKLDFDSYYQRILAERPDFLVMESATRTIDENLALALKIKRNLNAKLVFTGQHASAFPQKISQSGVDYVCVGEYEFTVLEIIQGKEKDKVQGLYPNPRRSLLDVNALPWPEDNDVSRLAYAFPGEPSSEFREIQMYASRGCPMSCNFCVARNVYYNQPNWRSRDVEDVIKEIIYLKNKYSEMEGIFFDEEVHNGKKDFILGLSRAVVSAGLNTLHYEAMCDVRFLDEEVLSAMKKAGYYKIRIGIETASERIMQEMGKSINLNDVRQRLLSAKRMGIKTYGTFTFGALGSDEAEDAKTIHLIGGLIKDNLLDNLQVSICTPQPGTPFYEEAKERNFLRRNLKHREYDGENFSAVSYPNYNYKRIEKMKRKAFLLRDHYLLKAKIKGAGLKDWIFSIYKRYGLWGMIEKAVKRVLREAQYQAIKW